MLSGARRGLHNEMLELLVAVHDELGLNDDAKPQELDTTAHVGSWSRVVGAGIVACLVIICVVHQAFCKVAGRAVNDTDAPELEELGCLRQVDTVNVRAGKLVTDRSAASRAAAPAFPAARSGRTTELTSISCDDDDEAPRRPRSKKKKGRGSG